MRSELLESATGYGRSAVQGIEKTAERIPTEFYVMSALGSIGISLTLKLLGRDRDAEFVGHWVPTLLTLGLLSKLIDHDRHSHSTGGSGGGGGRRGGGGRGRGSGGGGNEG